jgi:glucan 1,3-beta-glucosidase
LSSAASSTSSSYSATSTKSSASSYSASSTTSSASSTKTSSTSTSSKSSSTTSSSTTSSASATASCDYWLEDIKSQGIAPFNSDSADYVVFRNVKDYGAKGDGKTDDTAAINKAISDGNRCAPGSCSSSTTSPALVYFPNGTYIVSSPIVDYYYTQIVGNPNCLPVLKASSGFTDSWVIDGSRDHIWGSTNIFWRQIRNFVIDMTAIAPSIAVSGIHWPTAQATSLQNIVFQMSTASDTQHVGLHIEDGSGGFVNDLVFYGGLQGLSVGNQQFTMRNLTFHNSLTAISQAWDWGWTYTGLSINNCDVGIDMTAVSAGAQSVASVVIIDSEINNTPIGISTVRTADSAPVSGGSLILENVAIKNVPVAVQGAGQTTLLAGTSGSATIAAWGQGQSYTATTGPTIFQGPIAPNARPASLTSGTAYYARSKPQYEHLPLTQFVSIRAAGAKGDGTTDDTIAINTALASAASAGKVVFFDAGYYKVTRTIVIPPGSKVCCCLESFMVNMKLIWLLDRWRGLPSYHVKW